MRPDYPKAQTGFTLVELIMVIVIMGVVGGAVAVFMRAPIDAYFAGGRRAALTDVADNTVRRIARDLHRALPNSIRNPSASCLEFIPTKTGERYRTEGAGALRFDAAVTSFNMLGQNSTRLADQQMTTGDFIVVYNLGISGADVYAGDNYSKITSLGAESAGETPINIASKQFPLASGGNRFHVVPSGETFVSYVCSGTSLFRRADTAALASVLANSCSTAGASVIATNVLCGSTSFTYSGFDDLQRNALATMVLSIQDSTASETINLHHEVHVDNTP